MNINEFLNAIESEAFCFDEGCFCVPRLRKMIDDYITGNLGELHSRRVGSRLPRSRAHFLLHELKKVTSEIFSEKKRYALELMLKDIRSAIGESEIVKELSKPYSGTVYDEIILDKRREAQRRLQQAERETMRWKSEQDRLKKKRQTKIDNHEKRMEKQADRKRQWHKRAQIIGTATPNQLLNIAYQEANDDIKNTLFHYVLKCPNSSFEKTIIKLFAEMGYDETAKYVSPRPKKIKRTGTNEMIINQGSFEINEIYIKLVRYAKKTIIDTRDIEDFANSLDIHGVQTGAFITTSIFNAPAVSLAREFNKRIVLIDGKRLAELMIRYNIGCRDVEVLHLKKVDEDFFNEYSPLVRP